MRIIHPRLARANPRQLLQDRRFFSGNLAEDGVDEVALRGRGAALGQGHRFVDRGVRRDPFQVEDLVRAQLEDGLDLTPRRARDPRFERAGERRLLAEPAVEQFVDQRLVGRRQPAAIQSAFDQVIGQATGSLPFEHEIQGECARCHAKTLAF